VYEYNQSINQSSLTTAAVIVVTSKEMPLWKEIDVAYDSMGCNSSTSDEDVVVACYPKLQSSGLGFDYSGHLNTVAVERKSRFLLFILSIRQHLNNENVAILAKKNSVIFAPLKPR